VAKFAYEITSKDSTGPGTKSAAANMESLGDVTKRVGNIMKAAFAGFTIAKIAGEIKEAINLFGQQEKAEIRLAAAAKNNPLLSGESVRNLKAYASELQSLSIYGDEVVLQQQSFLASLGLSEEQIKDTMKAAVDLASTGMVSLESATRNLAKTYGGMTGELGELIPGLKTLTKEELEAGKAVEYIATQYDGMAEAAAQGVSGAIEQTKNMVGDMKESLGEALAPIVRDVVQAVQPIVEKVTGWIKDHQKQITNVFLNLPEILSIVFTAIWEMIKKVFTLEFWVKYLTALGTLWLEVFKSTFQIIGAFLRAVGVTLWEPLKTGFEWVVYGIKVGINAIIEALNTALEGAHNVMEAIKHPFDAGKRAAFGGGIGSLETARPEAVNTEAMVDAWRQAGGDTWDALKQAGAGILDFAVNVGGIFAPIATDMANKVGEVLDRELPAKVTSPVEALIAKIDERGIGAGVPMASGYEGGAFESLPFGGGAEEGGGGGGILKMLGQFLGPLMNSFGGLSKIVSMVMMVMQPFATILKGVMQVLEPIINKLLTPLIGILTIIGRTLGQILAPTLEFLGPIIDLIGKAFVWLYNKVILPIGNLLITIFTAVANFSIAIINAIIWAINLFLPKRREIDYIQKLDADSMKLTAIDQSDLYAAGQEATGADGSGGTAASYTAGRTINQTVNIYTDVIAGEAGFRQLAIMIRDEIFAVEALGA